MIQVLQFPTFKKWSLMKPTVDGSEILNNHLGWCILPCKWEDKLPFPQLVPDFFHEPYFFDGVWTSRVSIAEDIRNDGI